MAEKIKLGSNGNFGVKEGGTLAYNDENGVFKAIELASSRASSGTYVAESGLIADAEVGVPRIDWTNGVGELLLEPASTNYVTYSEDFTDSSWSKGGISSIGSNLELSPDGATTADRLVEDTSTSLHTTQFSFTPTSGVDYTFSVFAKAGTKSNVRIGFLGATPYPATPSLLVDLSDGSLISQANNNGYKIEDYGNGWYKLSITASSVATATATARIYLLDGSNNATFTGDGSSYINIWGAQLESLTYPTSYIRTSGSSVTRIADAVTGNSSLGQVINSSEGVLYAEMSALFNDGTDRTICLFSSVSDRIILFFDATTNRVRVNYKVGGADQCDLFYTLSDSTNSNKIAFKYSENDFALWVNGVEQATDPSGSVLSANALNTIIFNNGVSGNVFYGRIRDLRVYDTALTDAELTALTSL